MISLFKAELLKTKNSKNLMSLSLVVLIWLSISFYSFYTLDLNDFLQSRYPVEDKNPWYAYFFEQTIFFFAMLLPLINFMIVLSIKIIEDKADGWKRMFALPNTIFSLYISKLAVIWLYCSGFVFSFFFLYYLSGILLSILKPDFLFLEYEKYDFYLFLFAIKSIYASLFLSCLAFVLTLLIKKFSISLVTSVLIPVLGFLLFDRSIMNPFTYVFREHTSFWVSRKDYFDLHKTFEGFTYNYLTKGDFLGLFLMALLLVIIFLLSKKPIIKYE